MAFKHTFQQTLTNVSTQESITTNKNWNLSLCLLLINNITHLQPQATINLITFFSRIFYFCPPFHLWCWLFNLLFFCLTLLARNLSVLLCFSNKLLTLLILSVECLFSISLISALIFLITFFLDSIYCLFAFFKKRTSSD